MIWFFWIHSFLLWLIITNNLLSSSFFWYKYNIQQNNNNKTIWHENNYFTALIKTAVGAVAGGLFGVIFLRSGNGRRAASVATGIGVSFGSTYERIKLRYNSEWMNEWTASQYNLKTTCNETRIVIGVGVNWTNNKNNIEQYSKKELL